MEHLHLPPVTRSRLCPHDCTDHALKFDARIFKWLENRVILYLNELGYSEIDFAWGYEENAQYCGSFFSSDENLLFRE